MLGLFPLILKFAEVGPFSCQLKVFHSVQGFCLLLTNQQQQKNRNRNHPTNVTLPLVVWLRAPLSFVCLVLLVDLDQLLCSSQACLFCLSYLTQIETAVASYAEKIMKNALRCLTVNEADRATVLPAVRRNAAFCVGVLIKEALPQTGAYIPQVVMIDD